MIVLFSDLAKREVQDAADFLDVEADGLGTAFEHDVQRSATLISRYPAAGAIERPGVRRVLLQKFYSIEDDHILVIAVAHQRRRPDYWIDR